MKCDPVVLSTYLDGELDENERQAVKKHAAECPGCARELERLQRSKSMIAVSAETPSFHRQLMLRVVSEEQTRGRRVWPFRVAAAALLMLAVAVLWLALRGNPSQQPVTSPKNLAVAPSPDGQRTSEPPLTVAASEEQSGSTVETPENGAAVSEAAQDTPAAEEFLSTQLALKLVGTTGGTAPSAVITRTEDGNQRVYAVGDTVLPGVTLAEVGDRYVVLDNNGKTEKLAFADIAAVAQTPSIDGLWSVRWRSGSGENAEEEEGPIMRVVVSGTSLIAAATDGDIEATGTLYGNHVSIVARVEGEEGISAEGNLNEERTEMALMTKEAEPTSIWLTKLNNEAAETQLVLAEREQEVRAMYAPLGRYILYTEGRFPDSLSVLVPEFVADLNVFANTVTRTVTYTPGARLLGTDELPKFSEFASFRTELPLPDRLMLWEKMLEERFGKDILFANGKVVLRVAYRQPDAVLVAHAGGRIETENATDNVATLSAGTLEERMRFDATRATCQNNLKQLGLIIKMFMNENMDYTPPGWLSTYPEYLTDTSVLTSPKDAPGTDSYVYLAPAVNVEKMADEKLSDYEDPAARAKFMSEFPLIINRTDFPGSAPGRNVLFADGHVEYIRSPEWREQLGPWLSESGMAGAL